MKHSGIYSVFALIFFYLYEKRCYKISAIFSKKFTVFFLFILSPLESQTNCFLYSR